MITRRTFLRAVALSIATAPLAAEAQKPPNIPRIGYLSAGASISVNTARIEVFRQGLRELGYVEGKTIVIE